MGNIETESFTLPSGAIIEFETVPNNERGRRDVSIKNSNLNIPLEKVIEPLGEVTELLFSTLKSAVKAPDSVSVELSASIKGGTNLLLVNGEGQGAIKVKLTWSKSD